MTKEIKTIKDTKESGRAIAYKILVEPWITEASTMLMELNKYVFKVSPEATKDQIKKSVEGIYGVEVLAVNTIKIPRKYKFFGRNFGWKTGFKKAIVTLKEGDKIEFFESK